MNKVMLMGRLTNDPEVRYSQEENAAAVARFTLAVNRRDGNADFIQIVAFGKLAETIEKYLSKGRRVLIAGRIQTGSYTNRDGQKVYTVDVIADEMEFADGKKADNAANPVPTPAHTDNDIPAATPGFMNIPDGIDEEMLPFN